MRPIDADYLIERIDKCYELSAKTGLGLEPVMALRDIKALISVMPTVGEWISVKDRLPTNYDRVPVLYKFNGSSDLHTSILWYIHEPFCGNDEPHWERIGNEQYEVLYWYELPEPPKDGIKE